MPNHAVAPPPVDPHLRARECAFQQGREACRSGVQRGENPHRAPGPLRTNDSDARTVGWDLGWDTERQAQTAHNGDTQC